jgi:hypothetical protein
MKNNLFCKRDSHPFGWFYLYPVFSAKGTIFNSLERRAPGINHKQESALNEQNSQKKESGSFRAISLLVSP